MHGRPRASARKIKSRARPAARGANRRWIGPAKAITKRHTSAGTCGDADLERQRAPDGTPRGSRAWAGLKEQRLWANWGRGGCVPTWATSQVEPLDPERKKKTPGAEEDVVLAHPRETRKVDFRYLWVTERSRGRG